tara:strand:+ start:3243 stop:3407 length:165 start_codon:yes stop_codon:yes gene_type:complete
MNLKPWQPNKILITSKEVSDAIAFAEYMGWPFCASPLNAAFVVSVAIMKVQDEN